MTVTDKVREVMDWNGIKQKRLSELTGIPQSTISHQLRNESSLTLVNLKKFADALGVSLWTLLNSEPLQVTSMDLTEEDCAVVSEYRSLNPREKQFLKDTLAFLNEGRKP